VSVRPADEPGLINLEVLEQRDVWIDAHLRVHGVATMDAGYRANVAAFLIWQAPRYARHLDALDALDLLEVGWVEPRDPERWMRARPIFRALLDVDPFSAAELVELRTDEDLTARLRACLTVHGPEETWARWNLARLISPPHASLPRRY
jgi:hypothetical protein